MREARVAMATGRARAEQNHPPDALKKQRNLAEAVTEQTESQARATRLCGRFSVQQEQQFQPSGGVQS